MARKCHITGLGTVYGNKRPHSLKASRRSWKANLHKIRIKDKDGKIKEYMFQPRYEIGLVGHKGLNSLFFFENNCIILQIM